MGSKACKVYGGELSRRKLWVDLETENDESRVELRYVQIVRPYRHMFAPPVERSKALTARLEAYFGDDDDENEWVRGVLCCEALTGKLNKQSLILDTVNRGRLHLDMSRVKSWSLFPGQVIKVKGETSDGVLAVAELSTTSTHRPTASPASMLWRFAQRQAGQPLSIWCASGPFTTSDNLDFKPLADLLTAVRSAVPDVLILCGPFIDATHPAVAKNKLIVDDQFVDPHTLFVLRISWKLAKLKDDSIPTHIVMLPSPNDATETFVYPCPPLTDRADATEPSWDDNKVGGLDLDPSIHLVSNPAVLQINELLVGISANDCLFDLATQEIAENRPDARIQRLASHLLAQRSFYPLCPPANKMPLDPTRLADYSLPELDILIAPSKLGVFANQSDHTLIINPGHLTKGTQGGTFAQLHVHPHPQAVAATQDDTLLTHDVPQRSRCEITRI